MEYDELYNELADRFQKYVLSKKAEDRDNLKYQIDVAFQYIDESNVFADVNNQSSLAKNIREQLFPFVLACNSKLPKSKKYPVGDIDFGNTDFLQYLPKSYLDYLPSGDIKSIKVKEVWNGKTPINPSSKEFWSIFKEWVSSESFDVSLRPQLIGVYIDQYGATGTDAHKLLHIAGNNIKSNTKENTIYADNGSVIDAKYPDYRAVSDITKCKVLTSLNCSVLLNALETLIDNNLVNMTTHQIGIKKGDSIVGFNAEFLAINCRTWLKLGVSHIDYYVKDDEFTYSKFAQLFTKKGENITSQENIDYSLIMPVMLWNDAIPDTRIEIIDENNFDVIVDSSPAYRFSGGQGKVFENDFDALISQLNALSEYESEEEKAKTKQLIADLRLAQQFS